MKGVHTVILLLLTLIKEKYAQTTAVITPRGYNASLDPEASFTFQCDVTGADSVQWLVDGLLTIRQDVRDRGISESGVVTVDETTGSFRGSISVTRNVNNANTTIICIANIVTPTGTTGVSSEPILFKIQGLLDAPSNLMLSETNDQRMRRLSWDKPFSLDITDIEQDISYYKVCYSISTEKFQCQYTEKTEFTFLYARIPLNFTVSAVNVVGEGEAMTKLYEATNCNNIGMYSTLSRCFLSGISGILIILDPAIITASQVQARVSFSQQGNNPMATFLFQQVYIGLEPIQNAFVILKNLQLDYA